MFRSFLFITLGIILGWTAHVFSLSINPQIPSVPMLRATGSKFTKPLLLCNSGYNQDADALLPLKDTLTDTLNAAIDNNVITNASIYLRNMDSGEELYLSPNETFAPASIQKVMMLIRILKLSEGDSTLLTTKRPFSLSYNSNAGATIPPTHTPQHGQEYSTQELLDFMIKYSDNISYELLLNLIGQEEYERIYEEVKLQYPESVATPTNFISAHQLYFFFRLLYNASYLSTENSETALHLLSQTDYQNGLTKLLPPATPVAHKYGITALKDEAGNPYGELHDCGIIYHPQTPYFLCVMTKSRSTDISPIENLIATISQQTFQAFNNNSGMM
jgi:beta-lactamase class A